MPGFQDFERQFNPRMAEGEAIAKRYLDEMISCCQVHDGQVFVAATDGLTVGFVTVLSKVASIEFDEIAHSFARVTELYVADHHRGRGIGRNLLGRAEQFAREKGATVIKIGVLAKNTIARDMYIRQGFDELEIPLQKNLD